MSSIVLVLFPAVDSGLIAQQVFEKMVRSLFIYASWGTGCKQGPSQSLCLEPFGLMQGVSQLLGIPFGGIFTMHSLAFLFYSFLSGSMLGLVW